MGTTIAIQLSVFNTMNGNRTIDTQWNVFLNSSSQYYKRFIWSSTINSIKFVIKY